MALRRTLRVDLEALLRPAQAAPPLPQVPPFLPERRPPRVRVAYAWDAAFRFYYPEALELLEALRAELLPFSPLEDEALPQAQAFPLGGGYPELHAERLAENQVLKEAIRRFPGPNVAECGGYMYLAQGLWAGERFYPMVGLVPGEARMAERPVLGYREVAALRDSPVARRGEVYRGHEFHYARLPPSPRSAWRRVGGRRWRGTRTAGSWPVSFTSTCLPNRQGRKGFSCWRRVPWEACEGKALCQPHRARPLNLRRGHPGSQARSPFSGLYREAARVHSHTPFAWGTVSPPCRPRVLTRLLIFAYIRS